MAKFAQCDLCGIEAALRGAMQFTPDGWVSATEAISPMEQDRLYLACSPRCMAALMDKRAVEAYPPIAEAIVDQEPARRG